ncbi:MAG: tetratricopeptide repeat protein [Methylococcales bacterium]
MNYKHIFFLLWLSFYAFDAFASCYDETRSAEENYASCKKAAEQGDATAQYFLGQMYRKGDGIEKNPEEALNWYRKAAEQENRLAQYNLGWMYDIGEGIERNLDEAISWYAKAARLGDKYAPFNIGALYFSGRDLPRDPENALFWFEVALANGNENGRKWRDKIAEHLAPEQLERIQKRFEAWTAKAGK